MWYKWIPKFWSAVGRQVTAIGAAIMAVVLLLVGHRRAVDRAENRGEVTGEERERNRINAETGKEMAKMKERADEVHEDSRDLDDDDLTKRMLEQQRNRQRRR